MKKLFLFIAIALSGMLVQAQTTDFDITKSDFPIKDYTQRHLILSNNDDFLPDLHDGSYCELKNLNQSMNKNLREDIYLCDSSYSFYWDESTSSWGNNWKSTYTYDDNGNPTEILGHNWDEPTSSWVNEWKGTYTYDNIGNLTEELSQSWDGAISSWVNDSKYTFTYDSNGNRTKELWQYWDGAISSWVNDSKYTFTYDSNGNRAESLSQSWDGAISSWVNEWKGTYTYDSNGNRTERLGQDWDLATNTWVNVFYVLYYYSIHQILEITDINISGISIYPNPVSQSITIENVNINATIRIYDMSGRLQISEIATTEKQLVDLSKLGKGVYILSIHDDNRTVSLKFIKN